MSNTTCTVIARPIGTQRQAIVSCGDSHMVVGTPKVHDTISNKHHATELLLSALATDLAFACQDEAQRLAIPLNSLTIMVKGTLLTTENKAILVRLAVSGPDNPQGEQLMQAVTMSSPVYQLLAQVLPIQTEVVH